MRLIRGWWLQPDALAADEGGAAAEALPTALRPSQYEATAFLDRAVDPSLSLRTLRIMTAFQRCFRIRAPRVTGVRQRASHFPATRDVTEFFPKQDVGTVAIK